jgi:hypothetical protein
VPSAHATLQRGGVQDSPQWAEACHWRKRPGWGSWRMDESALLRPNSATPWPRHPLMGRGSSALPEQNSWYFPLRIRAAFFRAHCQSLMRKNGINRLEYDSYEMGTYQFFQEMRDIS